MPKTSKKNEPNPVTIFANQIANETNSDILFYNGEIGRNWDQTVIDLCRGRKRRNSVLLFMITLGGDADAGFRIARALQSYYERFTIVISGICKSAGTLIAIGSHEIAFGESGELGPLDVQLAKKDELLQSSSGLNIDDALESLQNKTLDCLEHYFVTLNIKSNGRITTKTATQIARDLVSGLYGKIFEQIDPLLVGETSRAMKVAIHYGNLLNEASNNLKPESLDKLAKRYPSHSFVIDRKEAESLFENVRKMTDNETRLTEALGEWGLRPGKNSTPMAFFLSDEIKTGDYNGSGKKTDDNGAGIVATTGSANR